MLYCFKVSFRLYTKDTITRLSDIEAMYCNLKFSVIFSTCCCCQLDQMLILQSSLDSDQDCVSPGSLQTQQNKDRAYRQQLQVFQEAQQRQAQLVLKLQNKVIMSKQHNSEISASKMTFLWLHFALHVLYKVLQYKKRCGELEEQVLEKTSESEKMRLVVGPGSRIFFEHMDYIDMNYNSEIFSHPIRLELYQVKTHCLTLCCFMFKAVK